MSNDINSHSDYWKTVERSVINEIEELDEEYDDHQIKRKVPDRLIDSSSLMIYSPRTVIYYTREGFYGRGHDLYIMGNTFEDNDSNQMIHALALAAFYNDVHAVLEELFEYQRDLGEATNLLANVTWSEGVEFEYEFKRELLEETLTYQFTFEHIAQGEWKMYDHHGDMFEVISPEVHVEQKDDEIELRSLKTWLDNICYRRLNDLNEI